MVLAAWVVSEKQPEYAKKLNHLLVPPLVIVFKKNCYRLLLFMLLKTEGNEFSSGSEFYENKNSKPS